MVARWLGKKAKLYDNEIGVHSEHKLHRQMDGL